MAKRTVEERFWDKVALPDANGCLVWAGARVAAGYGRFWTGTDVRYAHRVAYEMLAGQIPDGLQLDHLCRNRACVAVDHLEPVTQQENLRRGEVANRTHCPSGHPYDEANTYVTTKNHRLCRACMKKHGKATRARRRQASGRV